jgi:hypothetical protein
MITTPSVLTQLAGIISNIAPGVSLYTGAAPRIAANIAKLPELLQRLKY